MFRILKKIHLDFMILYNFQDIIIIQMYEIVNIQMHFYSTKFIVSFQKLHMCTSWKNIFFTFFIWTKYEKKWLKLATFVWDK